MSLIRPAHDTGTEPDRGQRGAAQGTGAARRAAAPALTAACFLLCLAPLAWAEPPVAAGPAPVETAFSLPQLALPGDTLLAGAGGSRRALWPDSVSPESKAGMPRVLLPAAAQGLREAGNTDRDSWAVGPLNPDHDDAYLYQLPYAQGASYLVLQGYGSRLSHRGPEYYTVDFQMGEGTPVHAAREGVVVLVEASNDQGCWAVGCARFANYVVVLHADGTTGEYFHIRKYGAVVRPGDYVERGQLIAYSGNTGYTTTPHLHFGVYRRTAYGKSQSIGVRFATRGGALDLPRPGARYLSVAR